MASSLSRPPKASHNMKRVAILFAGGPAPAANAVISTAAVSFLRSGIEVIGIKHGYSSLIDYDASQPLAKDKDYIVLDHAALSRTRNSQGIMIGTARANPGKNVSSKRPSLRQRAHCCITANLRGTVFTGSRCADFDWWRRHAQDRQQIQTVSAKPSRRFKDYSCCASSQNDRQRLFRD